MKVPHKMPKSHNRTHTKDRIHTKSLPKFRFMAMSKLIGLIAFLFVFVIVVFCMYEMHRSMNYDSMPQLIISSFGFAAVYTSFYLLMAKMEHIEEEKTKRETELMVLKNQNADQCEIDSKRQEISDLISKMNDLISESTNGTIY